MKRILVVAAVIRRHGKILIARRAASAHQGGLWEFPGGKVEAGEAVEAALCRELNEELGIMPTAFRPLIRVTHDYTDKSVCLDVWEVSAFDGTAQGREGQPIAWVSAGELAAYDFPAANAPIVRAAQLPPHYFISPDALTPAEYLQWLDARLASGATLILFRAPSLSADAYLQQAARMWARCQAAGAQLLLHDNPDYLAELPADGVHLSAARLQQLTERPFPAHLWLSASVHSAAELAQAEALGVDFVTLSPVQKTASHPQAAVLGWEGFAALAAAATCPVYALGGMTADDCAAAWRAGGQGVAGIRGL